MNEKLPIAPKPSDGLMEYYRDLLSSAGVRTFRSIGSSHGAKKAKRIVLVQTQGHMPTRPLGRGESYESEVGAGRRDTGGQTCYVLATASKMADMGRHVTILAQLFGKTQPILRWKGAAQGRGGVDIVRIPPAGIHPRQIEFNFVEKERLYPNLYNMSSHAVAVSQLVGAQAVIGHYADGGVIALEVAEQLRIPMLFVAHSLGLQKMKRIGMDSTKTAEYLSDHTWFSHRLGAELAAVGGANFVVSTSPGEVSAYKDLYKISIPNHVVMPAGVAQVYYEVNKARPDPGFLKQGRYGEHGLRPNQYFLNWGRITREKNLVAQVHILAALRKLFPGEAGVKGRYDDAKLVIVGWNRHPDADERVISQQINDAVKEYERQGLLNKDDVVKFRRMEPRKIAHLASHAIGYLGTQDFEPFGIAPAENLALGHGITIVSEHAGVARWMEDGWNGVLIDPANSEEAARKIHNMLSNQALTRDAIETGAKLAKQFEWSDIAREQAHILDAIFARKIVGRDIKPTRFSERAYHRSWPVWFGREHKISEGYLEKINQAFEAHLKPWVERARKHSDDRVIISLSGNDAREIADYLATAFHTSGMRGQRIPGELLSYIAERHMKDMKNRDIDKIAINDAAVDLRGVDVVIIDQLPGETSDAFKRTDIHVSAGEDSTFNYYTCHLRVKREGAATYVLPFIGGMRRWIAAKAGF